MKLKRNDYVPALRWRQGEYQALLHLSNEAKDRVVPFITIPEIEYDFETQRDSKSIDEHVQLFGARYKTKWGKRPAWIGIHKSVIDIPLGDGTSIFTYVFRELQAFDAGAVPAIPVHAASITVDAVAPLTKGRGAGISLRLEDLMRPDARLRVEQLTSKLKTDLSNIDLILDLGAPNFEPYDAFADALILALRRMRDLDDFRNSVLIGTAIPGSFSGITKGGDEIPRHDWMFYRVLTAKLPKNVRRPNFGDYTIVHPEFSAMDMRMVKSSGKVVYTTPNSWSVHKGGAFRDNRAQMHDHCAAIVGAGNFSGEDYSSGDDYIAKCAARKVGPSNQTRWKEVGINHHITRVLDDLATLDAGS